MIDGVSPFTADSTAQIYKKIVKGLKHLKWRGVWKQPKYALVKDLVIQLLPQNPQERLPMRLRGPEQFKAHGWYTDTKFDWEGLANQSQKAPYLPTVRVEKGHVPNFGVPEVDRPPMLKYEDCGSGWDAEFATCK